MTKNLPRIAIFDLTDCEGCEVELISLRTRLLELGKAVKIANWRLAQSKNEWGQFDIAIVEGSPITKKEISLLKKLRENSKFLVALGTCATLAGIPGMIDKKDRSSWYKKIYGPKYTPKGIDALPLSAFVKVDFPIHGCPVDPDETFRIVKDLLNGKMPKPRSQSVCYECKLAKNPCRLLESKLCLGPIIQAGCKAVCVSGGSPCYGCFGIKEGANVPALLKILNKITNKKEIGQLFTMFLNRTEEYKKISNQ